MLKLIVAMPCPFCVMVVNYINDHNLDIEIEDTEWNQERHLELKAAYGKTQVPLLLIDGSPLYESRDIIKYLEEQQQ